MKRRARCAVAAVTLVSIGCTSEPRPSADRSAEIQVSTAVVETNVGEHFEVTVGVVPNGFLDAHRPILGRVFADTDRSPTAVLSHAFWEQLGGEPGIVGSSIVVAATPRTVIGVLQPEASVASDVQVFVPR